MAPVTEFNNDFQTLRRVHGRIRLGVSRVSLIEAAKNPNRLLHFSNYIHARKNFLGSEFQGKRAAMAYVKRNPAKADGAGGEGVPAVECAGAYRRGGPRRLACKRGQGWKHRASAR